MLLFVPAVPAIFGSLDTCFRALSAIHQGVAAQLPRGGGVACRAPRLHEYAGHSSVVRRRQSARSDVNRRKGGETLRQGRRPVTAAIEDRVSIPIGQSLLAIARKNVT
jgi:hypothetical protein